MMSYDREFYVRREQQERSIARNSIDPAIAAIHTAMAERYAELAAMSGAPADQHLPQATRAVFPERTVA